MGEIKTLQQGLGFIKKGYNSIEAATTASTGNGKGKVVFDTLHKIICVDGVAFGGNITDVTFTNSVLTITKATGNPVEIDFSDIASASSMMAVFRDFAGLIGLDSNNQLDYSSTDYLSELGQQGKSAKNLVNADKLLDSKIKAVKNAAGLNNNLEFEPDTTRTEIIDDASDITEALTLLDEAIQGIQGGTVTNVKINGTSIVNNGEANIAVDGTYDASNNKIATEETVSNAVEALDVNGYEQAEIDTATTQGQTTLTIKGIKEEDGKIAEDSTKEVDIEIDGTYNASTNKIATKSTVTTAIEALDGSAVIASQTGNVVTIKTGVTEANGVISNDNGTDIVLKEVAATGAAADVSIADAESKITATTVEGALTELAKAIEALQGAFDVIVSTDAASTPQGVKWGSPEITGTLAASANTFHKIYLVPADGTTPNAYSEYITTRTGAEGSYVYGWEKLGDIAVDLTGYVKTVTVNGKVYEVDSNSTNISLGDVVTAVNGETAITGGNSDYVAVTATTTKDTTTGSNTVAITSTVKTHTVADATVSSDGLATAKNVKDYVDTKAAVVNIDPTIKANDTTSAQIAMVGGTVLTAKVALFWDEWEEDILK